MKENSTLHNGVKSITATTVPLQRYAENRIQTKREIESSGKISEVRADNIFNIILLFQDVPPKIAAVLPADVLTKMRAVHKNTQLTDHVVLVSLRCSTGQN